AGRRRFRGNQAPWLRSRYEGSPRSYLGVALRHPFPQGLLSSGRDGTPLVPARIEGLRRLTPCSRSRLIDSRCPIVGLPRQTVNSRTLRAFDPPASFGEPLFSQRRRLYCLFTCISPGMTVAVTMARVYTWPHQPSPALAGRNGSGNRLGDHRG